jgi:hypothetical protein
MNVVDWLLAGWLGLNFLVMIYFAAMAMWTGFGGRHRRDPWWLRPVLRALDKATHSS